MTFFSLVLVFFLIIDPFGKISSYLSIVEDFPARRQRKILLIDMLIALGFMVLFNFIGEFIFNALGLADATLHISAGLILFLAALKILFPSAEAHGVQVPEGEPFIIPIAIPMIAGPALLATIMMYAHIVPSAWMIIGALFVAWLAAFVIMFFAPTIERVLGSSGLIACERMMGMVLVLLGVQRIVAGITVLTESLKAQS